MTSFRDIVHKPEAFYHGLLLGFTASLYPRHYEVTSNKKSGEGFYDVAIFSKDLSKPSIILEFKIVKAKKLMDIDEETEEQILQDKLYKEAGDALIQIEDKQYAIDLEKRGVKDIIKIGIAFCGKSLSVQGRRDIKA